MALAGFRVWSLVWATLISTAIGAVATFGAAGWRPSFSASWRPIMPMVRFGLQYQTNTLISLFSGYITPTFVAAVLGATAVGYITWASQLAFYPLMFMYIVARVTFPVIARTLGNPALLQRVVESAIRMQSYIIFPSIAALAGLGYYVTHVIYTDKWLPALPVMYLLLVSTACASVSSTLTTALNAMGKPAIVTRLMLMWLVLLWVTAVPLVLWLGYVGYAVSNACVASTVIVTVLVFKRYQPVRVLRCIASPAVSATVGGVGFYVMSRFFPPFSPLVLVLYGIGVFALFAILEFALDSQFSHEVDMVAHALRARLRWKSNAPEVTRA
jgi:O-antigen/teichoic acid export membrane protein